MAALRSANRKPSRRRDGLLVTLGSLESSRRRDHSGRLARDDARIARVAGNASRPGCGTTWNGLASGPTRSKPSPSPLLRGDGSACKGLENLMRSHAGRRSLKWYGTSSAGAGR